MLQGISKARSSSSSQLKLCVRCTTNTGRRRLANQPHGNSQRVFTRATESLSEDGPPSTYESPNSGPGPSSTRMRNVWTKMQEAPKRQCILTRKTLPADYLLKLKPRSYPAGDGADTTYLTPSVFSKCDPGRSHYLTLHREVIARIHEPGPHLGILAQNNIQIPQKLDEWIQSQLEQRLIKELGDLVTKLRYATSKYKNLVLDSNAKWVISRHSHSGLSDDLDQLIVHLPPSFDSQQSGSSTNPSEVDLRSLSPAHHSNLFESLNKLLSTDRTYLLRQATANKTPLSRDLIGKPEMEPLEGTTVTLSSGSERGQLVLPVMTALLRLKLYSGHGWGTQL